MECRTTTSVDRTSRVLTAKSIEKQAGGGDDLGWAGG